MLFELHEELQLVGVVGYKGLAGLLGVELRDQTPDLFSEGKPFSQMPEALT